MGGNFPPQKTATISAANVNAQGITAAVAKALQPAYIHVLTGGEGNSYQGIHFAWAPGTIYQFHMTYLAAWLCGIIPTYTHEQENQFYVIYDLSSDTAEFINVLNHNNVTGNTSRIVFPLLNGGINRLTISSDELATSQYINGHKTATIAEIQLRPSTQVKYPNVPNWQHDIIEYFLVPHPQSNDDGITLPDICATPDLTYYPNVLPSTIPYLRCNLSQYQGVIEPVVVRLESGSVVSRPTSTHFGSQVGELRIDLQHLKDFSFKWLIVPRFHVRRLEQQCTEVPKHND